MSKTGLVDEEKESFTKGEEYPKFFNFLKKSFRNSATRRVSWAVWYLYSTGVENFTTYEILELLSYNDEDYIEELKHLYIWKNGTWHPALKRKNGSWQIVNDVYSIQKPILTKDLPERLFTAIVNLSSGELSEGDILQKVRELEIEAINRALRRLKLTFEDGRWKINNTATSRIEEELRGKQSLNWPYFGSIIVRGNPYFKMFRGVSCTAYVDIPNKIIEGLVEDLIIVSNECDNKEEFYIKAQEVLNSYNRFLRDDAVKYFKHNLDWLHFELYGHFMDKYGVRIRINWKKFMKFIDEFSKAEIPIWVKYRYISLCRRSSLKLVLRGEPDRTQKAVKEVSKDEIAEIQREITEFIRYLEFIKGQLMKMLRRRKVPIEPAVLLFLPEMMATINSLKYLVDNGAIPSCYREMRKILENLAWVVFDDILLFRSVKNRPEVYWLLPPYRYVSKEWYESIRQQKGFAVNHIAILKNKIRKFVNTLGEGTDWDKKSLEELERAIFNNLSYPSFLLILGEDVSIASDIGEFIPVYDTPQLLTNAKENFKEVAKSMGLEPEEFAEKAIKMLEKATPPRIIPPYPSNDFVIAFVDRTFSTKLQKKYNEYSFFVHSYFTSWHIFPFSSVFEFKVLKYELKIFIKVIKTLLDKYLEILQ